MHPTTYYMFCEDMTTMEGANLPCEGYFRTNGAAVEYMPSEGDIMPLTVHNALGDTQVPSISAFPRASDLRPPPASDRQHRTFSSVAHGDLPNNPQVIDRVLDAIVDMNP